MTNLINIKSQIQFGCTVYSTKLSFTTKIGCPKTSYIFLEIYRGNVASTQLRMADNFFLN